MAEDLTGLGGALLHRLRVIPGEEPVQHQREAVPAQGPDDVEGPAAHPQVVERTGEDLVPHLLRVVLVEAAHARGLLQVCHAGQLGQLGGEGGGKRRSSAFAN